MVKILTNFRFFFLTIAIIGSQALTLKKPELPNVQIVTSEQMKELLKQHPNAVELTKKVTSHPNRPVKDTEIAAPHVIIEYTLGYRVGGDYLIAHDEQALYYASPRDVQMTIRYPSSGSNGRIVTYVNILIGQSSVYGRAYVISGGIGLNYISIVVEADNTYFFEENTNLYGY